MKSTSRRQVLKAAVGSLAGAALGLKTARPALAQSAAGVLDLGDDLYVLDSGGQNVVAFAGRDGIALVDGGPAASSAQLLERIGTLAGGAAVQTLFNSHWHPEQTGLNERLGRAGARIISHENTRLWLTTDVTWPWSGETVEPLPEVARPNDTFYTKVETSIGPTAVEYGHLRDCPHTDGDLYVHFREANVLCAGGAVNPGSWPLVDWWTGGWIGGLVGGHAHLLYVANEDTRIVPASGPVLSYAELQAQYEMYDTIYSRISQLLYAGMGTDDVLEAAPAREFDDTMGNSDDFVKQAFRSTWAYLSPDA